MDSSPLARLSLTENTDEDFVLRLRFLRLDEGQAQDLHRFWVKARPHMQDVIDSFYTHLADVHPLPTIIEDKLDRLKGAQLLHWERLFSGRFDLEYVQSVRTIGQVHHRIGLAPRWYIGAYSFILGRLTEIAILSDAWGSEDKARIVRAVSSAVMLDMDIAISVYVDATIELEHARQAANAADGARQQIARLLSGLPAAVYRVRVRHDGAVTSFTITENVERVSGWQVGDFPDWDAWSQQAIGVSVPRWQAHFLSLLAEGEASIEYSFTHKNGVPNRLRVQVRVVERHDHEVEAIGYVSDITRDHALRSQAVATAKLATLGEMAAGLAHEMNQPISIMSLAAENVGRMLESRGADGIPFALTRMERIKEQAARARTIINHLRIFGRQGEEDLGPVNLYDVVDGALSMVGGSLRSSSIVVSNELGLDIPPVLAGLILAEQVVVNVLLNARDAMNELPETADRRLIISATTDRQPGTITLEIADRGPGIPAAVRERIFDPFFTTKDVGKGTGLGLSLCHGIMKSFGGGIAADEAPGGGALILMTFPRCEPPLQAASPA